MSVRATDRRTLRACLVAVMSAAIVSCGYKGPLVVADPAAPADKSVESSRVPDASSAAPPRAQDADRVIDEGDADSGDDGDDAP